MDQLFKYSFIPLIKATQNMTELDHLIQRLNQLPPTIKKHLLRIRILDKQIQQISNILKPARQAFLQGLHRWSSSSKSNLRRQVDQQYQQIVDLQTQIDRKSKEKVSISEQMYDLVHNPTQQLENQLQQLEIDARQYNQAKINYINWNTKKSKKDRFLQSADPNDYELTYCYCNQIAYGQMVMCQNTYCQKEWFHKVCIKQYDELPEKWYCKNCAQKKSSKSKSKLK